MLEKYGRTPGDFSNRYKEIDDFIRREAAKEIKNGKNIILDYGFWNKEKRAEYYQWAKMLTPNVQFNAVLCDIDIARERILQRTLNNPNELHIDENCFNTLLKQYEPITEDEDYPVIFYNNL